MAECVPDLPNLFEKIWVWLMSTFEVISDGQWASPCPVLQQTNQRVLQMEWLIVTPYVLFSNFSAGLLHVTHLNFLIINAEPRSGGGLNLKKLNQIIKSDFYSLSIYQEKEGSRRAGINSITFSTSCYLLQTAHAASQRLLMPSFQVRFYFCRFV